ncbi:MAG: alpha/beta hydrolase [Desulfobacterales bacterium]|nr:alpha/beta hydrolase [Desulfobacterales bacterium]
MIKPKITTGIVNKDIKIQYYRYIHEVTTEDGRNLIMTHKVPVDKKPLGPIMFVHGLGQNRYTWTQTKRSMENYFVSHGFETFNIELRGHGLSRANGSDYPKTYETYLNYDMPAFFDAIREATGGQKIFYIGHSLGGTIAYCLGSQFQEYLAGIVSIGGPFIMAKGNTLVQTIAKTGVFIDRSIPWIRKLYPRTFYIDFIGLITKPGLSFLDSSSYKIPLQVWYPETIERDILIERIERGFDRTGFNVIGLLFQWGATGKFYSSDRTQNFENNIMDLHIPLLFVVGDRDYAVPLTAVQEGFDKAGSTDKTLKVFGDESSGIHFGHIDLITGQEAPKITWPYMLDWINSRISEKN